MAKSNFHNKPFDEATLSKLEIFREYFKESFPVFVHSPFRQIVICDFFAGRGLDLDGNWGTSLSILNEIKPYCDYIIEKKKKLVLIFNDKEESDFLKSNIKKFIDECHAHCPLNCFLEENLNYFIHSEEFEEYFHKIYPTLKSKNSAKLLFLDPYNFVIDKELFNKLIDLPNSDFICFVPTSFLRRFPEVPAFKKFIDVEHVDFKPSKPEHCHRAIADYYQSLIKNNKEYYIGCFSIKKGSNYYGLLFGTGHTLGAEKFQKVCWKKDDITGEAHYDIDRELIYDKKQGILFEEYKTPGKLKAFQDLLETGIINKEITTDISAYKLALKKRCLVKHSADVLNGLMESGKIKKFRTKNSNIHNIKIPNRIELI